MTAVTRRGRWVLYGLAALLLLATTPFPLAGEGPFGLPRWAALSLYCMAAMSLLLALSLRARFGRRQDE